MNIFKPLTLKWWQIGLFKLCTVSLGIILGAYFPAFFLQWIVLVTVLCVAPGLYILSVWLKR